MNLAMQVSVVDVYEKWYEVKYKVQQHFHYLNEKTAPQHHLIKP